MWKIIINDVAWVDLNQHWPTALLWGGRRLDLVTSRESFHPKTWSLVNHVSADYWSGCSSFPLWSLLTNFKILFFQVNSASRCKGHWYLSENTKNTQLSHLTAAGEVSADLCHTNRQQRLVQNTWCWTLKAQITHKDCETVPFSDIANCRSDFPMVKSGTKIQLFPILL